MSRVGATPCSLYPGAGSMLSWLSAAVEAAEGMCTAARTLCSPFPWLLACPGTVDKTDTRIGRAVTQECALKFKDTDLPNGCLPAAVVPLCGLGVVPGNIAKVSSWSQTFGKCRVSGSLCSPEASSLGLGQTLPCSSKVSVKVSSWVWLNPEQRQVGFSGAGGSHESLHGDVGPAHLRGGLQGGRGPCLR